MCSRQRKAVPPSVDADLCEPGGGDDKPGRSVSQDVCKGLETEHEEALTCWEGLALSTSANG